MIRIALVLACCATVCAQVSKPSHRRALLVGVNTYARLAPDRQLRGPAHDAQALGELLRAKFGFDDVRYLLAVDPQPEGVPLATIAGFRAEMDALVERSASGFE